MAGKSALSLRIAWEAAQKSSGARIHVVTGATVERFWREGLPADGRADHLRPAAPLLMVGFRTYGDHLLVCVNRDVPQARDLLPLVLLKLAGVLWIADRHAPPGTQAQACALLADDGYAVCVEQRPRPGICPDCYHVRGRSSG
jgi:hypothetical protein